MELEHPGPEIKESRKIEHVPYIGQHTSVNPHHNVVYNHVFKSITFNPFVLDKLTVVRITSTFEEVEV